MKKKFKKAIFPLGEENISEMVIYIGKSENKLDIKDWGLEEIPIVSNYNNFLDKLSNEISIKFIFQYKILLYSDTFYIFKSSFADHDKKIKIVLAYKPENKELLELTKNIFSVYSDGDSSNAISSPTNHFSFIGNIKAVRVIYDKYYLESMGITVFEKFKKVTKRGKVREIIAPNNVIKKSLQSLNEMYQRIYDRRNSKFQVAYKKGKSIKDGAKLHVNNKYIFNMDLTDFYPSCKRELVRNFTDFLFRNSINQEFLEEEFLNTILIDDGLFIGSPVSGTIANAIISGAAAYLDRICTKNNYTLSIYADDISFSSNTPIEQKEVEKMFNSAFKTYGLKDYFKINRKKSVGLSGCNRKVTGVSINENDQITIGRKYYRYIRSNLSHLSKGDNVDIQKLRGKIAYATAIDDSSKVINYLKKYKSIVQQYSLYSGTL